MFEKSRTYLVPARVGVNIEIIKKTDLGSRHWPWRRAEMGDSYRLTVDKCHNAFENVVWVEQPSPDPVRDLCRHLASVESNVSSEKALPVGAESRALCNRANFA